MSELAAAQEKLARSDAAAADTAHLSTQQRAGLAAQLDEARQAVAAAQSAADAAHQRAVDAACELETIRRQLADAQAQAMAEAQAQAVQAPDLTPVAKLRSQLGGVHESLVHLHAEQCAGRLHAPTPELDQARRAAAAGGSELRVMLRRRLTSRTAREAPAYLHAVLLPQRQHPPFVSRLAPPQLLEASRAELAHVEVLLGGDTSALRSENAFLRSRLKAAHSALVRNSPVPAAVGAAAGHNPAFRDREQQEQYDRVMGRLRCLLGDDTPEEGAGMPAGGASAVRRTDSPVPFALFGRLASEGEDGAGSPASSSAAPSPDIFNSPFLAASQTTLTVDYRDLHSDLRSGWQQVGWGRGTTRAGGTAFRAGGELFLLCGLLTTQLPCPVPATAGQLSGFQPRLPRAQCGFRRVQRGQRLLGRGQPRAGGGAGCHGGRCRRRGRRRRGRDRVHCCAQRPGGHKRAGFRSVQGALDWGP